MVSMHLIIVMQFDREPPEYARTTWGDTRCVEQMNEDRQMEEQRAKIRTEVVMKCIRKEHYPPDDDRTNAQRQTDTVTYAETVDPTTWDKDLSQFVLYGSSASTLKDMRFYYKSLFQQKKMVYSLKRATECMRMDCEFEQEVAEKIRAIECALE